MGRLRYKGYTGSIEFSEEDNSFVGEVLGLKRNAIIFEGSSVEELRKDFEDGVDSYLEYCCANNIAPEKPYSGKLVLRIQPSLHGEAAERAADCGISLNEFISRAIQAALR
ncbi:MAG: type II toxin-antitoxin system HicB family antitoxin [Bacteroidales bacterium]|nr:type II toxin-antitoxin system HicB family antitoxin [Bacteroidales bacterium]